MGLALNVGWLSQAAREDEEGLASGLDQIADLNAVLTESGESPHDEPTDIAEQDTYEAQMWGYAGLHAVRRLAAYHALTGQLPPPCAYEDFADDPLLLKFYADHSADLDKSRRGFFSRLFGKKPKADLPFAHLIMHSDSEGFYLPRLMDKVVFDMANPPRDGLGGMVGSSVHLLEECLLLAHWIGLPDGIDPECDDVVDAAEAPGGAGWRMYGIEAFCLIRLVEGCRASIRHKGTLLFT
ncbi:hypothetical protein [Sphingomonas sp. VDB2]|uniref:hypothetical protein n=1 Tax=Sphingomonas sp. VDB2 TaxID=3228751 RepID=UPI003A7F6CB3